MGAKMPRGIARRNRGGTPTRCGIAVVFLTFDLAIKLVGAKEAVEGTVQLGWQSAGP